MPITQQHRAESLCLAYLQAVAADCGLSWSIRNYDYGIDLTLCEVYHIGDDYFESGFRLDLQLKTTSRFRRDDDFIYYDLDVRTYERLRDAETFVPRILILLTLPGSESGRLSIDEDAFTIHGCAYWLSLRGQPPTANRRSIRVSIPRANIVTQQALQRMLADARKDSN